MKYRYVVIPGIVISEFDGAYHYIEAVDLARLYGVDFKQCYVIDIDNPATFYGVDDGLIVLTPRSDGQYYLHKCETFAEYMR